jgi:hypothetical protein
VRFRNRALASCRAFESVRVSVTEALEIVTSALPTMACSMAVPRFELVVVPQVPDWSPVPMSSIFKSAVS